MRLLLVEDNQILAQTLLTELNRSYIVDYCASGREAICRANSFDYDLIILDLILPDLHGSEVLKTIRSDQINCPVLILTACQKDSNLVPSLDLGADDYLLKPFQYAELLARIRVLLRRRTDLSHNDLTSIIKIGKLTLDYAQSQLTVDQQLIPLAKKEFLLLSYLIRHRNHLVTREMIGERIWEDPDILTTNTIEVHISRLRKKIDLPFGTHFIQTMRKFGYRFTT